MERFKDKYRISSNRLPEWDYSKQSQYFVTICTGKMICCFGEIINGVMQLSAIGKIAQQFWQEIPECFENIMLDKYQIMPNHVHGIVEIVDNQKQRDIIRRDAINRVSTVPAHSVSTVPAHSVSTVPAHSVSTAPAHSVSTAPTHSISTNPPSISTNNDVLARTPGGITGKHNPMLTRNSLSKIIRWYKGRCTYEFGKMGYGNWFAWQPRFYDHIIRNSEELHKIRNYIRNNPLNWNADKNNPKKLKK